MSVVVLSFVIAACGGGGGSGSGTGTGAANNDDSETNSAFGSAIQFGALANLEGTNQEISLERYVAVKLDPDSEKKYLVFAPNTSDALNNTTAHRFRIFGFNESDQLTDFTAARNPENVSGVIVRGVLMADFDGDGLDDVYFSTHGTEISSPFPGELDKLVLNDGNGILESTSASLPNVEPGFGHITSLGDLDGDTDVDVFVNNLVSTDSYVLINNGSSQWDAEYWDTEAHNTYPDRTDNAMSSIFINQDSFSEAGLGSGILDIDNDDDNDIVVFGTSEVGSTYAKSAIFVNDGDWNFSVTAIGELFDTEIGIEAIRTGDIDGDGTVELIGMGLDAYDDNNYGNIVIKIYDGSDDGIVDVSSSNLENNGVFLETAGVAKGFDLVDLDNDGDLDIYYKNQLGQDRNYESMTCYCSMMGTVISLKQSRQPSAWNLKARYLLLQI